MIKKSLWKLDLVPAKFADVTGELEKTNVRVVDSFHSEENSNIKIKVTLIELDSILNIDGVEGATYVRDQQKGSGKKNL